MSWGGMLLVGAVVLGFVGERLLVGYDALRFVVTGLGVLAWGGAVVHRLRVLRRATQAGSGATETFDEGHRLGHRVCLRLLLSTALAALVYLAASEAAVRLLGLGEPAAERYALVLGSVWKVLGLASVLAFCTVDAALVRSPLMVLPQRVRQAFEHGLAVALTMALVVPVNYVASRHSHRFDLAYFKTTSPGSATVALVAGLPEPVTAHVFAGAGSEVMDELRGYFEALRSERLHVEYVDQAADPRLARALKVRENGVVTFTRGTLRLDESAESDKGEAAPAADPSGEKKGAHAVTKVVEVGESLEAAKRNLQKLDGEVQKALIDLAHGERIVYFTTGHGEFDSKGDRPPDEKITGLKKLLGLMNFDVRTLGRTDGLAEGVPSDATLVAVVGPSAPWTEAEAEVLSGYLARGGALLVALEPKDGRPSGVPSPGGGASPGGAAAEAALAVLPDALDEVLRGLGVKRGEGVLASLRGIYPMYRNTRDRTNLLTDRFSVHESTAVLSQGGQMLPLFTPKAGFLEQVEGASAQVTVTVRSLPDAWADLDGDLEWDESGAAPGEGDGALAPRPETKQSRILAAVSTGSAGSETQHRALVVADASVFSDLALTNPGNQQFAYDGLNWLIGAEGISGTVETEEDIKIQHTKAGQAGGFYATVLAVPGIVLAVGAFRVRRRRRSSSVTEAPPGGKGSRS